MTAQVRDALLERDRSQEELDAAKLRDACLALAEALEAGGEQRRAILSRGVSALIVGLADELGEQ